MSQTNQIRTKRTSDTAGLKGPNKLEQIETDFCEQKVFQDKLRLEPYNLSSKEWMNDHNYHLHKIRLKQIKKKERPTFIPETFPRKSSDSFCLPPKAINNLKGKLQVEEKNCEIERENVILLNKISKIMMTRKVLCPSISPNYTIKPNLQFKQIDDEELGCGGSENGILGYNSFKQENTNNESDGFSNFSNNGIRNLTSGLIMNPNGVTNQTNENNSFLNQNNLNNTNNAFKPKKSERCRSLNKEFRSRTLVKIASENQEILFRIQNKRSEYSVHKLQKQGQVQEKLLANISKFKRSPSRGFPKRVESAKPASRNLDEQHSFNIKKLQNDGYKSGNLEQLSVNGELRKTNQQKEVQQQQQSLKSNKQFRTYQNTHFTPHSQNYISSLNRIARQGGYFSKEQQNRQNTSEQEDGKYEEQKNFQEREQDFAQRISIYKKQKIIKDKLYLIEVSQAELGFYIVIFSESDKKTFRLTLNEEQADSIFMKIDYDFDKLVEIMEIQNGTMVICLDKEEELGGQQGQNGQKNTSYVSAKSRQENEESFVKIDDVLKEYSSQSQQNQNDDQNKSKEKKFQEIQEQIKITNKQIDNNESKNSKEIQEEQMHQEVEEEKQSKIEYEEDYEEEDQADNYHEEVLEEQIDGTSENDEEQQEGQSDQPVDIIADEKKPQNTNTKLTKDSKEGDKKQNKVKRTNNVSKHLLNENYDNNDIPLKPEFNIQQNLILTDEQVNKQNSQAPQNTFLNEDDQVVVDENLKANIPIHQIEDTDQNLNQEKYIQEKAQNQGQGNKENTQVPIIDSPAQANETNEIIQGSTEIKRLILNKTEKEYQHEEVKELEDIEDENDDAEKMVEFEKRNNQLSYGEDYQSIDEDVDLLKNGLIHQKIQLQQIEEYHEDDLSCSSPDNVKRTKQMQEKLNE